MVQTYFGNWNIKKEARRVSEGLLRKRSGVSWASRFPAADG